LTINTGEVIKVTTDVSAADVAIPALLALQP
jgi:TusA-related sulfurtransferase